MIIGGHLVFPSEHYFSNFHGCPNLGKKGSNGSNLMFLKLFLIYRENITIILFLIQFCFLGDNKGYKVAPKDFWPDYGQKGSKRRSQ